MEVGIFQGYLWRSSAGMSETRRASRTAGAPGPRPPGDQGLISTASLLSPVLFLASVMLQTATLVRELEGIQTDVLLQAFADRILVLVTQLGKVGSLVSILALRLGTQLILSLDSSHNPIHNASVATTSTRSVRAQRGPTPSPSTVPPTHTSAWECSI